jgi:2-keto-4-pentenoate hydratase/2-oxohepta-3-ene-1,7-dioic acid hydratase in catechol pathway
VRLARITDGAGGTQLAEEQFARYTTIDVELRELMDGAPGRPGGEPVSPCGVLAPLQPGKVVTIAPEPDDAREGPPEAPLILAHPASSVVGPHDPIPIPWKVTRRVDWGVALAVIIGREACCVDVEDALDHVFGYTVGNDVCAHLQFSDGSWVRARSVPCSSPATSSPTPTRCG